MAQNFQASQRLLTTLTRACMYYQGRPTLLSTQTRNYSLSAANERSGFSVTFADGSLQSILAKPSEIPAKTPEEAKVLTEKAPELWQATGKIAKPKPVSAKQSKNAAAGKTLSSSTDAEPAKKTKSKGKTLKQAKGEKATTKALKQEREKASSPEQTTWHEMDEPDLNEVIEKEDQKQHLQRDYPDTRTIEEAGYLARRQDENLTKSETVSSRRGPRPLSTYKEPWQVQKAALKNKFTEGWDPRKKLSPDTMEGIRALHAQYPDRYTTAVLAEQFAVSPEAIRRILKSKWSSNLEPEKVSEIRERWAKRHDRIWDIKSQIGLRPKRKGAKEIEDPDQFEEELRGRQLLEAHRNA